MVGFSSVRCIIAGGHSDRPGDMEGFRLVESSTQKTDWLPGGQLHRPSTRIAQREKYDVEQWLNQPRVEQQTDYTTEKFGRAGYRDWNAYTEPSRVHTPWRTGKIALVGHNSAGGHRYRICTESHWESCCKHQKISAKCLLVFYINLGLLCCKQLIKQVDYMFQPAKTPVNLVTVFHSFFPTRTVLNLHAYSHPDFNCFAFQVCVTFIVSMVSLGLYFVEVSK